MVATTAKYPIDSPARQMLRRWLPIVPVNVLAFVETARPCGVALAASGEGD